MFDRCIFFNVNALARKVNRVWDEAFRTYGLSPAHAYTMRVVLRREGISLKELARELHLDPSTVTRFVDLLASKNLVERRGSEEDRRVLGVYPTKAGKQLQQSLEATGEQLFQKMRKKIGAEKFDKLVSELRAVKDLLE